MPEPSNSDLLNRISLYHADVQVALDRTVHMAEDIKDLYERTNAHGLDIAKAKGGSAVMSVIASGSLIGIVEMIRSVFGGGHHP